MNNFLKLALSITIFALFSVVTPSVIAQIIPVVSPPSRMVCVQPLKKEQYVPVASLEYFVPSSVKRIVWENSGEVNITDLFLASKIRLTDGDTDLRNLGIVYSVQLSKNNIVVTVESESQSVISKLFLESAVASLLEKLPLRPAVSLTLSEVGYSEPNGTKVAEGELLKVVYVRCR